MKKVALIGIVLALVPMLASQPTGPGASLDPLQFLVGKWVGEGGNEARFGSGYFTFESALQAKALVRKNHAEYPASKDRPAYLHDDLMIVYVDPTTKQLRAFYTDNEGHVINYTVSVAGDGKSVVFLSEPQAAAPGYRLTYVLTEPSIMLLTFEVAPPGKPFQKFLEGKVRKSEAH